MIRIFEPGSSWSFWTSFAVVVAAIAVPSLLLAAAAAWIQ